MADFLAEVDEAMRQERVMKFWQEHGTTVLLFVIMTIIATAGLSGFRHWNAQVKTRQTAIVMNLVNSPDFPENIQQETLDLRGGLKGIVLLNAADAYYEKGDMQAAGALYQRISNDKALPDDLRHLGMLMRVRLGAADESGNTDEEEHLLREIWGNAASPWRYHARLQAAVLQAHNHQNYQAARAHLAVIIKDAKALPEPLIRRARALDRLYAVENYQKSRGNQS